MTEVGMSQLTRERHDRVIQAEQSAELSVIEYLKQHYMIEEELLVGKKIAPYNNQITYPPDVYITYDAGDGEQIYRTLTSINALKRPTDKVYWEELMDFEMSDIKFDEIPFYSQMITWKKGDLVKFNQSVWKCVNGNGIDFNNIQIPGVVAWKKLDTYEWHANLQYEVYDVVMYDGRFFMLLETADPEGQTLKSILQRPCQHSKSERQKQPTKTVWRLGNRDRSWRTLTCQTILRHL
jgi:hypothetical protein